jgi:hypothetical protein
MSTKQTEKKPVEEKPILSDPDRYPDDSVLKEALGERFNVYTSLLDTIKKPDFGLTPEWNYYKDGKAWLCKVMFKKKTILWLSVWPGYFKIGFYFTEKHVDDIKGMEIDDGIKKDFFNQKTIGKLIPMVIDVSEEAQLDDVLRVVGYKKSK